MQYKLTVADCVERIASSKPDVILNAIRRGELRAINIANGKVRPTWRISEEDFAAWIESRAVRPTPEMKRSRRNVSKPKIEYV